MLERGETWEAVRARFRWNVPARLNIARQACDAWAEAEPERLAIVEPLDGGEAREWTYAELKALSEANACALAARGVGRGDRVAVLLPQGAEAAAAHLAVLRMWGGGAAALGAVRAGGAGAPARRLARRGGDHRCGRGGGAGGAAGRAAHAAARPVRGGIP